MLKQIAWNTFKNTGNINTFMELLEVDKIMENKANGDNAKENKYMDKKDKIGKQKWEL